MCPQQGIFFSKRHPVHELDHVCRRRTAVSKVCYWFGWAKEKELIRDCSQFRLPSSEVTIIMAVVVPVSGILTQPIVGAWSDRLASRHGR
jgi:hypothetical protein